MITTVLLTIYVLSAIGKWNYFRLIHSKGGKWEGRSSDMPCLFITLAPVLNTFFNIAWIFKYPVKGKDFNLDRFFNIKK